MKLNPRDYGILYRIPFDPIKQEFKSKYPPILIDLIQESDFSQIVTAINRHIHHNSKPHLMLYIMIALFIINSIGSSLLFRQKFIPLWAFVTNIGVTLLITSFYFIRFLWNKNDASVVIEDINKNIDAFNRELFKLSEITLSLVGNFSQDSEKPGTYIVVWVKKI